METELANPVGFGVLRAREDEETREGQRNGGLRWELGGL
jgi:hypothetical protein